MGQVQKRAFAFKRMVIFDQPSLDIKKKSQYIQEKTRYFYFRAISKNSKQRATEM